MIRGKYLRERKAIRVKRRFKFLVILTIGLIIYKILCDSFSLFESQAESAAEIDIAFFAIEDTYKVENICIDDIKPGDDDLTYVFYVSNYIVDKDDDGNDVIIDADTTIDYKLSIETTTNLPLEYELYIGQSEGAGTDCAENIVTQDTDHTYFNKIFTDEKTFKYEDGPMMYTYTLRIKFPEGTATEPQKYKDAKYQDIIECIQITLDAKQKVS